MNLILKQGDLVTYFKQDDQLDYSFNLGSSYRVTKVGSALVIDSGLERLVLVRPSGELTDASDHFKLDKSDIKLPLGNPQ